MFNAIVVVTGFLAVQVVSILAVCRYKSRPWPYSRDSWGEDYHPEQDGV